MSRSPKYSTVRASELIRERLEAERQARERKRKEEQERRAKAALARSRAAITRQVAAAAARCAALAEQPSAVAADLTAANAALERARRAAGTAANDDEIAIAVRALDEAERLRVAAAAEVLRRSSRHAAGQLAAVRGLLAELDAGQRTRFSPITARTVDESVVLLATALDNGNIALFEQNIETLLTQVRAHHQEVTTRAAEHAEHVRTAKSTFDELAARVAGLTADAQAARTPLGELPVAADVLGTISAKLAADRPIEAMELAVRLAHRLDDLEEELDTAIERLSARREMLGSIIEALPSLGFAVDQGSFVHGEDGSIGMEAHRRSGEALVVVVQDDEAEDHRINYLRESGGPLEARACSSLKSLAEELNSSLRRNGFSAGSVTWDEDGPRPVPGHRAGAGTQERRLGRKP
ncbi:hypothetical protein SAMN05421837_103732 [Amycolatopsis pretoriensis]|uniref:Uncharacterized protein n=1 Tax=Amycolatopsis pretoriensis TaxID=218821 RepID=A0A1H5QPN4_9PSEU|nr:hypothetical protein [Amycolatopsis pretoriensis]SEF27308.1 hypothetical protein SAMN05421837_103732 [Amycolatopsis pretoriensis]